MSDFSKKVIRKINKKKREFLENSLASKKKVLHVGGGTVVIRPKEWVEHGAKEYLGLFSRQNTSKVKGNIKEVLMLSRTSQCKDWFLELELRSEKWTFNKMLAVVNPYGESPLSAVVLFTTMMEYGVRVTVKGDIPETDIVSEYPRTKMHRIPVLGLYAGRTTDVVIEILDDNGDVCDSRRIPLETNPLPEDLENVIVAKKINKESAFQNILISGGVDIKPCAFDREGKIRFYLSRKPKGYGIFPLSKGRFLFMEQDISAPTFTNPHSVQMYDMDYLGRVGKTYFVKNGAHHTVEEKTKGGNILTAGNSLEADEHSEDLVLELDRETAEIVHKIKVGELFDDKYQDMKDWAHINSASYDEEQDSMLVSMRNIHSVAKFDWSEDEIKWIMADPRFWEGTKMTEKLLKPIGEVPWFYQQHAVFDVPIVENPPKNHRYIMVFDNHWHKRRKVKFFDKDKSSYVSFYDVDEKELTVKLYKRIKIPKSKIRSNAIFDEKSRHLYSMAGYLVPEIDGNLGVIQEFEFDSEKKLAEYYVKPGFFRAHEFQPDMVSMSKPLVKNTDYLLGDLKRPEKLSEEQAGDIDFNKCKSGKPSGDVFMRLAEDVLYVHESDHLIQKVYFVEKGGDVYEVDYDDTHQTMKTFEKAQYSVIMWLDKLPEGQYDIYLKSHGELYNNRRKITKLD
ncbi:MAG: aryl-sulfate sulfotransferase [Eubacterium sp.]|nr:aryl-sulfate sulfotransferase [Eubacterium sp.]